MTGANWLELLALVISLVVVLNLLMTLLAWPHILRPVLTLLFMITSLAAYFMNQYGVMIDINMIRNVVETDLAETADLLSLKLAVYVLFLGVLPIFLLWQQPINWRSLKREIGVKLLIAALSAGVLVILALANYQNFASLARNHRELRFLLTPTNYLQATSNYLKAQHTAPAAEIKPFGTDAKLGPAWQQRQRKSLTVIVVGESVRSDHLGLNGYPSQTNPQLAQVPSLISLSNVWSCGTDTAVSVPCMFSGYGRKEFSRQKAQQRENLLDIMQRAGLSVQWRENQAGCKEVCNRIQTEFLRESAPKEICGPEGCFDEALLNGLAERIDKLEQNTVLVLHMMGNHGPAYYKRYPAGFEVFLPVCHTSQLEQCQQQEIANAYDNALRYTDSILARLIGILEARSDRLDTAMLYISDHGQSLGEHNLYLHGTPYLIAPDAQKHVPMLLWFSQGYQKNFGIDTACLAKNRDRLYSHDNLFHSVLGLLDVQTKEYQPDLDIFKTCRSSG